jgi:hypothetical protein
MAEPAAVNRVLVRAPLALITIDERGVIDGAEGRALAELGRPASEIVGATWEQAFGVMKVFDGSALPCTAAECLRRAMCGERVRGTTSLASSTWSVWVTPTRAQGDGICGAMCVIVKAREASVELVDVREVLEEQIETLASRIVDRADVVWRLEPELPPVSVDRFRLGQIVATLIQHALHALRDDATSRRLVVATRLEPSGNVRVEIGHDGTAIPANALLRLFDPAFRMDRTTTGEGMCLAVTQGLARTIGAELLVQSDGGETWFTLVLPTAPLA